MNRKRIAGWIFLVSGIMMLIGVMGQIQDFIPRLLKVTENIEPYYAMTEKSDSISNKVLEQSERRLYMRNRIFLIEYLFLLGFGANGILAICIFPGLKRGERRVWGLAFIPTFYMLIMAILIPIFTPQDWMHSFIYTLPFGLAMFISLILCHREIR